jgi:hypothetical protein
MKQIGIAARIPADWHKELQVLGDATGENPSEIVRGAIALYLKKSQKLKVASRLDALESSLGTVEQSLSNVMPAVIADAWRKAIGEGEDSVFFAKWAISAFMLREGFADATNCPVLPFKVWGTNGAPCYQLAPTTHAAAAMARAEGVVVVQVDRGWM